MSSASEQPQRHPPPQVTQQNPMPMLSSIYYPLQTLYSHEVHPWNNDPLPTTQGQQTSPPSYLLPTIPFEISQTLARTGGPSISSEFTHEGSLIWQEVEPGLTLPLIEIDDFLKERISNEQEYVGSSLGSPLVDPEINRSTQALNYWRHKFRSLWKEIIYQRNSLVDDKLWLAHVEEKINELERDIQKSASAAAAAAIAAPPPSSSNDDSIIQIDYPHHQQIQQPLTQTLAEYCRIKRRGFLDWHYNLKRYEKLVDEMNKTIPELEKVKKRYDVNILPKIRRAARAMSGGLSIEQAVSEGRKRRNTAAAALPSQQPQTPPNRNTNPNRALSTTSNSNPFSLSISPSPSRPQKKFFPSTPPPRRPPPQSEPEHQEQHQEPPISTRTQNLLKRGIITRTASGTRIWREVGDWDWDFGLDLGMDFNVDVGVGIRKLPGGGGMSG
ncbi:MAG: hypothetical protein M1834_003187 [Cirrosporium novae-zelandiae]|nr:MAG: hypothetical protein M1834_003187 [Cirrosporium novae-zelandiae]